MSRQNHIFCLMGKSGSGKDSVYRGLKGKEDDRMDVLLKEVIPYTTRPARTGEVNGQTYYFETQQQFQKAKEEGQIIESRDYHTVHGIWHYYTKDDGQIDLRENSYLIIGTLESYRSFQNYYGREYLVPLYIEVEDGERLQRALLRERQEEHPRYAEMCRRYLADEEDFSEKKLMAAGIERRFANTELDACIEKIRREIQECCSR